MSFTPFDDTQTVTRGPSPTTDGYSTSEWDYFRQGVEITNDKFRFLSTQPKIWSGNTNGETSVVTYGQTQGNIEEDAIGLGSKFLDLPRFDPIAFLQMGEEYPYPIVFNDGPRHWEEASVEPLIIPFKKHTNEGPFYAHDVRGELEDGNSFDSYIVKSSSRVSQFVEIDQPTSDKFFLDQGGDLFGNIQRVGYVANDERLITPFDDLQRYSPESKLQTTNSSFLTIAKNGIILGNENALPYGNRSQSAGYTVYGLNTSQYGIDSIAFSGWSRGS